MAKEANSWLKHYFQVREIGAVEATGIKPDEINDAMDE